MILKVVEYLLPRFDNMLAGYQSFWEWQAARIQNFMNYLILHNGYKPKYYDPYADKKDQMKVIEASHVA